MTRRAIYPGSFDPPTIGHIDIVERGAAMFDELVVAIGNNTEKSPYLPLDQRLGALRESTAHIPNVKVASFDGLLVDYAKQERARIILRGLRAISDYDYELRIGLANRKLNPEVETVFLIAREEFSFLASSVVREVARLGGDYRQFVPPSVVPLIERRLAETRGP
ncbi:MAG: pantetheine-phosphate adenylyltransferase [Armatimonadetes bacterium]|nr:pantetheine-phosphate adenylyltransferase [Armatimonadota bacterium]MBS1711016.1 pantetheine-phosphate adenylyltransferase [Armatimonadota bacterium]MBX3108688.1 pantetheine-phosphate adenylyltransferase [Fimbriimonadaceae bacterium]